MSATHRLRPTVPSRSHGTGARIGALAAVAACGAMLAACNGGGTIPASSTGGTSGSSGGTTGGSSGGSSGGGGTTVTPTPYTLFSSNYVAYAQQAPSGAFVHSIQKGDVHTVFGGNINYGCFSFSQAQMDGTQFYAFQAQADSNGGPPNGTNCQPLSSAAPTTASDFAAMVIFAPGTSADTTSIGTLDISQASTLLVQMGNIYTQGDVPGAVGGNATVFTITLNNDTSTKQDGSGQTALCQYDQTLTTIGRGATSPLGVLNYAIPLSSFTCSKGSMGTLQASGVSSVSVGFSGDKNPKLVANELDVIAVGYVGFTK